MTDHEIDIRLVGFAGFEASERFLRALDDEIWVARWGLPPRPRVHRPTELTNAEMMRHELELPCKVVVISAHVGYDESDRICFFSESGPKPILYVDKLGKLGATSMVLVDGCSFELLYPHLKIHTQPGVRMVGLKGGVRKWTQGRDSVAVVAAVMRELCYATKGGLSLEAVDRAVELVNAQIAARNEYISGKEARMPSLDVQLALRSGRITESTTWESTVSRAALFERDNHHSLTPRFAALLAVLAHPTCPVGVSLHHGTLRDRMTCKDVCTQGGLGEHSAKSLGGTREHS